MTASPDRAGLLREAAQVLVNMLRDRPATNLTVAQWAAVKDLRAALDATEPGLHCAGCEGWTSSGSKCEGVLAATEPGLDG